MENLGSTLARAIRGVAAALVIVSLVSCEREVSGAPADDTGGRSRAASADRSAAAADSDRTPRRRDGERAAVSPAAQAPRCTFRDVHFLVEPDLILEVRGLVGELRPTGDGPVTFDDPRTFTVWISEATVAVDMRSLEAMMNRHVFGGENAKMRDLEMSTEGERLRIKGTLHQGIPVPFNMLGEVSATEGGEVRIVPVEMHAAGLPVRGLLDFFGVELDDLVTAKDAVGIRVEENTLFLQPRAILPPPRLDGRIVGVKVEGDRLIQRFGGRGDAKAIELPREAGDGNSLAFLGGVLRFGRLTMTPADLTLVDADPSDPFLFSMGDYLSHLTAGYSRTLVDGSLVTVMPDHDQAGDRLPPPKVAQ